MTLEEQKCGLVYQEHPGVVSRGTPCDSGARYQDASEDGALRSVRRNLEDVRRRYPPLTAEQERALVESCAGDRKRLNELLVLHNIGFARDYTSQYSERSEDAEDMWMRGIHGLAMAAENFDPSLGKRFCTVAGYYIQKAMRDLFDPMRSGPKTQLMTQAVYDEPKHGGEEEDAATVGEWFHVSGDAPDWTPPAPDSRERDRLISDEVFELIEYFVMRYASTDKERSVLRAKLRGRTFIEIAATEGGDRHSVRYMADKMTRKIRRSIARADRGSELYNVICSAARSATRNAARRRPKSIDPNAVFAFMAGNGIVLSPEGNLEDMSERVERMAGEYMDAEREHQTAAGRLGGGADYDMMRAVYADTVIRGNGIFGCAERLGIPVSYAKSLRDSAMTMVEDHKKGKIRDLYRKGADVDHGMKDEMFTVVAYGERGGPSVFDYLNAEAKVSSCRSRKGCITTWKRFYGGFYSQSNYIRMKNRDSLGNYRITKREARALAQFCEDVLACG